VRLREIIEKMNTLFEGDELTDADKVGFTGYIGGKFGENTKLRKQASANTLEQFLGSPDLADTFMDAVIESDTNFSTMSEQLLGNPKLQKAFLTFLAQDFYQKYGREGAA
jgi:type I restriction enzyme R subunit